MHKTPDGKLNCLDELMFMFQERVGKKVCVIKGELEIGSGSLVNFNHKNYLLTCEHVANPLLSQKRTEIETHKGFKFSIDDLNLCFESKELDIALYEITKDIPAAAKLDFFDFYDFDFNCDFEKLTPENNSFFFFGLPSEQAKATPSNQLECHALCYYSIYRKNMGERLILEYPKGNKALIKTDIPSGDLPHPGGTSGSLVFMGKAPIKFEPNEFISMNNWKAVAIQQSWNQHDTINCNSIKIVHNWFNELSN